MTIIPLRDAEVYIKEDFYSAEESVNYFEALRKEVNWRQDDITVFGKPIRNQGSRLLCRLWDDLYLFEYNYGCGAL